MMKEERGMPLLELRLLGACEVLIHGSPLPPLRYRKDLWLLALLALRYERTVDRNELAALFWPDAEASQALYYLRRSLSNLRHALGAQAHRLFAPSPRTLRLDLSGADCDLRAFDAALARAAASATPEELLQQAVALYRGPLLPGCLEEWVLPERQVREQAYLSALETLAVGAIAEGQPIAAVRWLRMLLVTDPYRESACCALMQSLADCGDQAAMTQVYHDLRLLLHRDLNAEPAPETDALYRSLHERQPRPIALPPASPPPAGQPRRLPVPLSDLIGREQEMEEVGGWLGKCRLVTLVGTGGVGKTRLSIAVAERVIGQFTDGVWFVDFAPLSDPALLTQTILRRLDIREDPLCTPEETLEQALSSRTLLLVLDNCEHLLESCASLSHRLLSACPGLRILATSREALDLTGEHLYPVPALSLPLPGQANVEKTATSLLEYAAVQLFVERARQSSPSFRLNRGNMELVAQICHRLDGIPLAIEMAAARLKALSASQIADRLEDRFHLLTGGNRAALPRHRTLKATIDWSYNLLTEAERTLFRGLSVFAGGWTLEAAEQVCAVAIHSDTQQSNSQSSDAPSSQHPDVLDLLSSLVDKSLVIYARNDETAPRYRLLETMRQYGRGKLQESGEMEQTRKRHRDYCLRLAKEAASQLFGTAQQPWLERLETEHDNMRAALVFCMEEPAGIGTGLQLAVALARFWTIRGHWTEGRANLERVLERTDARREAPSISAQALLKAGNLAWYQGDYGAARAWFEESLPLFRELDDRKGIANTLSGLSLVANKMGDDVVARPLLEESLRLFREVADIRNVANSLCNLGVLDCTCGDSAAAQPRFDEALRLFTELRNNRGISFALQGQGDVALLRGDYMTARALYEESFELRRDLGDTWGMAATLYSQGDVAFQQGDYAAARAFYEESLDLRRRLGDRAGIAVAYDGLGRVAFRLGDEATAQMHLELSLSLCAELGDKGGVACAFEGLAEVLAGQARAVFAAHFWGVAATLRESIGTPMPLRRRQEYERSVAAVRSGLGEEAFATAWAQGSAMTIEQAVTFTRNAFVAGSV